MIFWNFLQKQILGMQWLHSLVGSVLTALGLDTATRLGGSIHFFLYDIVKITISLRKGAKKSSADSMVSVQIPWLPCWAQ